MRSKSNNISTRKSTFMCVCVCENSQQVSVEIFGTSWVVTETNDSRNHVLE